MQIRYSFDYFCLVYMDRVQLEVKLVKYSYILK